MNKLICVYKACPSSPFEVQVANGRCRLFSVWSGSIKPMSSLEAPPVIQLYDATGATGTSGTLKATFVDTVNSHTTSYGSHWSIDLPSSGILFEEGIYFKGHEDCKGIGLFINGGKEN